MIFKREPAIILGFVGSVIALIISFGLDLSHEQVGGIMAAVTALLALVTRSQVVPTDKIINYEQYEEGRSKP